MHVANQSIHHIITYNIVFTYILLINHISLYILMLCLITMICFHLNYLRGSWCWWHEHIHTPAGMLGLCRAAHSPTNSLWSVCVCKQLCFPEHICNPASFLGLLEPLTIWSHPCHQAIYNAMSECNESQEYNETRLNVQNAWRLWKAIYGHTLMWWRNFKVSVS